MKNWLSPSMMCCDFLHVGAQLSAFERTDVELLHIDVMDGRFVPNFALGVDFCKQLKRATRIPLDYHFMVEFPEQHLDAFPIGEGDVVSVHYEATRHLQRVLSAIRARGARAFVALNPATPSELLLDVLEDLDGVLLMTVNPGYAGQRLIPHALEKITRTRRFLDTHGRADALLEVDGNVSVENAKSMRAAGADIYVLGTSAVFRGEDLEANVRAFRAEVFPKA